LFFTVSVCSLDIVSLHQQLPSFCCCAVGTYADLHTAIRERDLGVLAVHGRKEQNPAAPATLLPASSYSEQEVAAAAAKLQQRVRGAGTHWLAGT
jgi:hypothetical protein